MKVLYLSETEDLQVLELQDVLDKFIETGVLPICLKYVVQNLETQGFDIGVIDGISCAVIKLNLPDSNLLVLSKAELNALYCSAVIETGLKNTSIGIYEANAWMKIGELTAGMAKPKPEKKVAHENLKDYDHH